MIEIINKNFSLQEIAVSGQCFRMRELPAECAADRVALAEESADNALKSRFEILAGEKRLIARQCGDRIRFDCGREEFDSFWSSYFDLETDYGRIIDSIDPADAYLRAAAESCPGMRILRQDPWEMLVTFLISQQNNIPRIRKCVENICAKYGRDMGTHFAFPQPEALACLGEDDLMPCNLGYRSKYVVRAARAVIAGRGTGRLEAECFDLDALGGLGYDEAMSALLRLFGVGVKVANCICLFGLHHVDAFPVDTHIKQIFDAHYRDGFPFERYRGYAGILQQYMFYYDLHGERQQGCEAQA